MSTFIGLQSAADSLHMTHSGMLRALKRDGVRFTIFRGRRILMLTRDFEAWQKKRKR